MVEKKGRRLRLCGSGCSARDRRLSTGKERAATGDGSFAGAEPTGSAGARFLRRLRKRPPALKSVREAEKGDYLEIILSDGTLLAKVEEKRDNNGNQ